MDTKYKKTHVIDRLPMKSGTYDSNIGEVFYNDFRQKFEHNDKGLDVFPEYWLEEKPDYEDEMKEMLEFIYGYGEKVEWSKVRPKLEELLTKLNQ